MEDGLNLFGEERKMTSIEALNRIECATDLTKETRLETTVSNPYFGEIQTIRKDLEVLGILKERCASANVSKDKLPNIAVDMHIELTEEEYMKVKEWLER